MTLLGLAIAAGCGSSGSGEATAGTTSAAGPSAAGSTVSTASGEPAAEAIPAAEVQRLFDAWLAAQNGGDLTAYLATYAERFEGVKRSGERVARMDRKGWAADRTRMFAKKMIVTAEDVNIATSAATAQVTFTQTWASGSYKDVGPKLLVVVREKGALKIAREEMLASTLQGVKRLPPPPVGDLAFVIQDGGTRAVLSTSPQTAWGEGAPELLADAAPFPTRKAVNTGKLPAALGAWTGKKVRLYGPSGPVCEATLGRPSLVARVIPHFGEEAMWHGTTGEPGAKPLSKPAIARAAWDLSVSARPHGVVLAADLSEVKGDCRPALWWQDASGAERKVAAAADAGAALSKRALEELRKLPEYKEIQSTNDRPGPWDERGRTEVASMQHPSGKQLVFIRSNAVEGCGGFQGSLSAVFEVNGGRLQLAGKPMSAPPEMPAGVVDEGAGRLSIVFTERLLRGETGYDQVDSLVIPFLDCGC